MKAGFDQSFALFAKLLYQKYNKPVILTEINIFSFDGSNRDPIGSDIQKIASDASSIMSLAVDHQEQADYYEALFQSAVCG